ncbi:hypothetical protein RIF29_35966 [Crotalaria pallida]|uniref:Bromo domain-containing protein n=1 Tax=Crotalaria pallida TaxID=3830 RepID=A0AAN9HU27_CROPI
MTWSSWDELLLGGAVGRHGTQDWAVVAAEIQSRTTSTFPFTPEVCKAKYDELLKRYSGSTEWYAELREKYIAELKKDLKLREESIGSLKLKIETLKVEGSKNGVENGSAGPAGNIPSQIIERMESSNKESTKDGLSAGSFTHETRSIFSPEDMETKPEGSGSAEQEKDLNGDKMEQTGEGHAGGLKKLRGKRKRKDSRRIVDKKAVQDNDVSPSADGDVSRGKEASTNNCEDVAKSSGEDENNKHSRRDRIKDIMAVLDSVMQFEGSSSFSHKNDSQKRSKYKSMIRQHMDFNSIRSRVNDRTIRSIMHLFRDLMLLINNALTFYSKGTHQYKTAQQIGEHVKNAFVEFEKGCGSSVTNAAVSVTVPASEPSAKLRRSAGNLKIVAKEAGGGSNSASEVTQGAKKPSKVNSPLSEESLPIKEYIGRPKKARRETAGDQRPAAPVTRNRSARSKGDNAKDLAPTQV